MIHGVWVNDYVQNSHRDAYDKDFYTTFSRDSITMIDVIHGKKKLSLGRVASAGHGTYRKVFQSGLSAIFSVLNGTILR